MKWSLSETDRSHQHAAQLARLDRHQREQLRRRYKLLVPGVAEYGTHRITDLPSSSFHQNGYKMKSMDFSAWLGERRRHSRSYGNDEQQRQTGKDAISCKRFGETDYWAQSGLRSSRHVAWVHDFFTNVSVSLIFAPFAGIGFHWHLPIQQKYQQIPAMERYERALDATKNPRR